MDTPHFFANGFVRFPQSSIALSSSKASQQNESIVSQDYEPGIGDAAQNIRRAKANIARGKSVVILHHEELKETGSG